MLGRRILQPVLFICEDDSAIESGYEEYKKNDLKIYDMDRLKIKDGEQPTCFKIKMLNDRQKEFILSERDSKKRVDLAVRFSLIGVENFLIYGEDGSSREVKPIKISEDPVYGKLVDSDWYYSELGLSFSHAAQIYTAIETISEATIPLSMQSEVPVGV